MSHRVQKKAGKKTNLGAPNNMPELKYELYRQAVQSPDSDVEFLRDTYKEIRGKLPQSLREDFCGTFAICCEWVKLNKGFQAIGLDLDPEPLEYGRNHNLNQLKPEQQKRISLYEKDVLSEGLPKSDVILAANFSYFVFKARERMKEYFTRVYESLNKDGIFVMDCFGGSLCGDANEENTKHRKFTYYWDQTDFDPVTHRARFHIHFKLKGQKKRMERVFSYDWRMWSLPELRDILDEVGFKRHQVYWEGTKKNGTGDGVFKPVIVGEACQSWIAYIVAEK